MAEICISNFNSLRILKAMKLGEGHFSRILGSNHYSVAITASCIVKESFLCIFTRFLLISFIIDIKYSRAKLKNFISWEEKVSKMYSVYPTLKWSKALMQKKLLCTDSEIEKRYNVKIFILTE